MMKKLFFLTLFLPLMIQAQTSFGQNDIDAAMGNRNETLLANVEPAFPLGMIQGFLQSDLRMAGGEFKENEDTFSQTYTPKLRQGEENLFTLPTP